MKRQLEQEGIPYKSLDNGILSCRHPQRLQSLCNGLSEEKIDALLRKWLARLPHPFSGRDRQAGYRYDLSILQIELSLTQVLDRPVTGRIFFEEVIRENLDIGRPKQVQLIFDRWVTRSTPGLFRTRVIADGVVPSLHVDYKGTRIKQYHKEGCALRTETTINKADALLVFTWLPTGFSNRNLCEHFASLLGRTMHELGCGQMTYQLRRLRLHGIIERIPQSHRYRITDFGLRTALFFTRTQARILRPGLAQALPEIPCVNGSLRSCFNKLQQEIHSCVNAAKLAA